MTNPTLPVSQPTHTSDCEWMLGGYACTCGLEWRITIEERDRELQQAREELGSAHWEAAHQQECRIKVEQSLSEAREELARCVQCREQLEDQYEKLDEELVRLKEALNRMLNSFASEDDLCAECGEKTGTTVSCESCYVISEAIKALAVPDKPDTKGKS